MKLAALGDLVVEVHRTNRKRTVAFRLKHGVVQMTVPMRMNNSDIRSMLLERTDWIKRKMAVIEEVPAYQKKCFTVGEKFKFLGRNYSLRIAQDNHPGAALQGDEIVVSVGAKTKSRNQRTAIRLLIEDYYKQTARQHFLTRTGHLAGRLGVTPLSVATKAYKARWGSCSVKGEISFNWRLIVAPEPVIDYVVIHELCHLDHPNHSRSFWDSVEKAVPEYRKHKAWLHAHGHTLRID